MNNKLMKIVYRIAIFEYNNGSKEFVRYADENELKNLYINLIYDKVYNRETHQDVSDTHSIELGIKDQITGDCFYENDVINTVDDDVSGNGFYDNVCDIIPDYDAECITKDTNYGTKHQIKSVDLVALTKNEPYFGETKITGWGVCVYLGDVPKNLHPYDFECKQEAIKHMCYFLDIGYKYRWCSQLNNEVRKYRSESKDRQEH